MCGFGFDKLQQLVDHCKTENHGNIKTFKCPKCSVEVQDEVTLKRHMCSHTGERAYTCHICGAKWEKQYALMEHLRMHAGIKPFDCPDCGEKFIRKGDLRVHLNRHNVNKFTPHKCQTCGEGFKQKAQLMVHERIHTGIKPYGCKACGKNFYSWKDLREHRRKHSGKRIYKCDHCGKTFATMNTLKIHVKMHMKGGAISCSICSKTFHDTNDYVHHTRFDHRVDGESGDNSDSDDAESVTNTAKKKRTLKNGKKKELKHEKHSVSESQKHSSSSEETSSDVESAHNRDNGDASSDSYNSDDAEPLSSNSSLKDSGKAADYKQPNSITDTSQTVTNIADLSSSLDQRTSNMTYEIPSVSQVCYSERGSGIENLVRASVLSDAVSVDNQASDVESGPMSTVTNRINCVINSDSRHADPTQAEGAVLIGPDPTQAEGAVLIGPDEAGRVCSGQFTLLTAAHSTPAVSMMSSFQDLTLVVPSSLQLMCNSSLNNVSRAGNVNSPERSTMMNPHVAEYVQGFKGLTSSVVPVSYEREIDNCEERSSQVIEETDFGKDVQLKKEVEETNIEQRVANGEQQSASWIHDQNNYEISDTNADKSQLPCSQESHYHQVQAGPDVLPSDKLESAGESQQLVSNGGSLLVQTQRSEQDASVEIQSQESTPVVQLDASNEGKETTESLSEREGISTVQSQTIPTSSLELVSQDQFIKCSQQMPTNSCQDNGYLSYTKYLTLPSSMDENIYASAIKDYTNNMSYSLQFPQTFHPQTGTTFTTEESAQGTKIFVDRGFDSVAYNLPLVSSVFVEQSALHTVDTQAIPRSVDYSMNLQTGINTSLTQEASKVTKDQQGKQDKGYSRKFYKSLECQYCGKGLSSVPALKNHEMIHTGERPYKCDCGKSFIDSSTFKRHQRIHTGIKPYMCDVCGKQFNQSNSYRTHMTCHTGEKHYKCNVCGHSFDKLKKLMDHNQRENHGSLKKHSCHVCSAVFRDVAALDRHMCSHTGEKAFRCQYCNKSYEKQYQFNEHMHSHAGFKPFKCEICGDSFLRKGQLKFHIYKHQYGRQFECEFCHQAFYRSTDLTVHRRIHTGEKPFKCDQCERSFRQKWECKNHQLWEHSTEKPFTCDKCFKTFKKSYSLKIHIQNKHENDKRHKCIICKKRFRKLENLKKHARKHRSLNCQLCDKNFLTVRKTQQHMEKFHKDDRRVIKITKRKEKRKLECSECGKKFCFKYDLDEHKRLHTGESIYKCTICSKIFAREYHLNIHTMKHTGEKRFKCDECGEPFTSGRKLKNHRIEKHGASETDIFKCEVCQREFADRNTMKKHVKSHSKEKPYECQTCGRRYQYSWNLKIHEKSSHTGDMPFKCRFCQKMFTHRRDFRDHVRSHTDNLPFKCHEAQCGRSFASLRALRMHQPIHFAARSSALASVSTNSISTVPSTVHSLSVEYSSSERPNVRSDTDMERYSQNDGNMFDTSFEGKSNQRLQSTCGVAADFSVEQSESLRNNSIPDKPVSGYETGSRQITSDEVTDSTAERYSQNNHHVLTENILHYSSHQSRDSEQRDSAANQGQEKRMELENDVQMHTDSQMEYVIHKSDQSRNRVTISQHPPTTESVDNIQQCFVQNSTSTVNVGNNSSVPHHQTDLSSINTEMYLATSQVQQHTQIPAINIDANMVTSYFHQQNSSTRNVQPGLSTSYGQNQNNSAVMNTETCIATSNIQQHSHQKGLPTMSNLVVTSGIVSVDHIGYMSSDYKSSSQSGQSVAASESVPQSQDTSSESFPSQNTSDEHVQLQSNIDDGRLLWIPNSQEINKHSNLDSAGHLASKTKSSFDSSVPHSSSIADTTLHRNKHSQVSHLGEHVDTAMCGYQEQSLESSAHNVVFIDGNPINYSLPFYKNANTLSQQTEQTHLGQHVHLIQPYDKLYALPRSHIDQISHAKAVSAQPHSSDATEPTSVTSSMPESALFFHSQRSTSPWNKAAVAMMPSTQEVTWSSHIQSIDAWKRTSEPATILSTSHKTHQSGHLQKNDNSWNRIAEQAPTSVGEPDNKSSYMQWSDGHWIRATEIHPIYASAGQHSRETGSGSPQPSAHKELVRLDFQSDRVESVLPATSCEVSHTDLMTVSGLPLHLPLRIPNYKHFKDGAQNSDRTELTSESQCDRKNGGHLQVSSVVSQALNEVSQSLCGSPDLSMSIECSSTIPVSSSGLERMTQNSTALSSGLNSEASQPQSCQSWKKCRFVKQHSLADKNISISRTSVQSVQVTSMINPHTAVAPVYTTCTLNCQSTGSVTKEMSKQTSEHSEIIK